jgi:hypothetical protein
MIQGKTPEEIRKLFNIVNDFTPEEEVRAFLEIPFVIIFIYASPRLKSRRRASGQRTDKLKS